MPYALPADMARQLLYLAGDKVDFDPWKRKLLEGGWMPRGGSGRSAGGGGTVTEFPQRNFSNTDQGNINLIQKVLRENPTLKRPMSEAERYEAALQAQRSQNMPSFNPQMTNPYPSKPMAQSYQERQPIPIRPQSPADTAQTSFPRAQEMMELRKKLEMAQYGRLLSEFERANLNRPGWESPQ